MHFYLVRVEMHGASRADYDRLHLLLEQKGIIRKAVDDNGVIFNLPEATYIHVSALGIDAIRNLVWQVALSVHPKPDVFVFRYLEASWIAVPH